MPETLLDSVQVWQPDLSQIITEDDTPVDNLFSEKQQRLLVEPLYSSWQPEQSFLAAANVGIFNSPYQPPIVPDMFLSLDVQAANDLWKKENRSYFIWNFGKPLLNEFSSFLQVRQRRFADGVHIKPDAE
jgi:hypothetical protein